MSVNTEIKKIILDLIRKGWTEKIGKHRKLYHPKGGFVSISASPSCNFAIRNIEADIKRLERSHGE